MHEVVVSAVAAAVMAATMTFNSTSQIFFLFIMVIYDLTIYDLRFIYDFTIVFFNVQFKTSRC